MKNSTFISSTIAALTIFAAGCSQGQQQAQPSNQTIKKIGADQVLHTSRQHSHCRDLRSVYYPTFDEIQKVIAGSATPEEKAQTIKKLESKLPSRVELSDTLVRSLFTRPVAISNIQNLPNAVSYGASGWNSLYDAIPTIRNMDVRVSPFFDLLYDEKEKEFLRTIRDRKDGFYPWTIYYDCETVLEVGKPTAPVGQRFLLFHSDMDMDADGSDGPRRPDPKTYQKDNQFQPEASYRWKERSQVENPFIEKWSLRRDQAQARVQILENQLAQWQSMRSKYGHQIDEDIAEIEKELGKQRYEANRAAGRTRDITLERHFVGELDPFIVCPHLWTTDEHDSPFAPSVGDYALVFYNNKVYPCLFADQGPNHKAGEASLALAKQIRKDNPRLMDRKITASFSPFYDLEVTYIVFPGTAKPRETWGLPNLEQWNRECAQLVKGLGGMARGYSMHRW